MDILLRTHREVLGLGVPPLPKHYKYSIYVSHDQKMLHFAVSYKKHFWNRKINVASLVKPVSESESTISSIYELSEKAWMIAPSDDYSPEI